MGVPGLQSISYNASPASAIVNLNFRDETTRRLGDAVLEPYIGGVQVLRNLHTKPAPGTPSHPADPIGTSDIVRAVASMRGVWNFTYADTLPNTDAWVSFTAVNPYYRDAVNALVRDELPIEPAPDGSPRMLHARWGAYVPKAQ
jgi:hypothetical protein